MIKIILATPSGTTVIGKVLTNGDAYDAIRKSIESMYPDDHGIVWKLTRNRNITIINFGNTYSRYAIIEKGD